MFKLINIILFVALFSACSSQDSKDKTDTNTTILKKETVQAESKKEAVPTESQKETIQAESKKETVPDKENKEETKKENLKSDSNTTKESLFTLKTLEGKTIHIDETKGGLLFKEYKDKAVLLLFFGHRCPPCLAEIPALINLKNQGHKDLEIIAIEVQGYGAEQLKEFKKIKGINYTLITYDESANFVNYISRQANWGGAIPFLVGFDKKTDVKIVHAGGLRPQDFDNIYKALSKGE